MKRFFGVLILAVVMIQPCVARTDAEDFFNRANDAYAQQKFSEAAELYEAVLRRRKENGALYYNLGNAYFRMGKIGTAVLNYERAMLIIPRDPSLRANHRYVTSLVGEPERQRGHRFLKKFFEGMFQLVTFYELCLMMTFFIFLLAAIHLVGLYRYWDQTRRIVVVAILGGLVLFCTGGLFWKTQAVFKRAVVLKESSAYFEPREDATVHFPLSEGDRVSVLEQRDGLPQWEKVRRFDGKIGWVPKKDIERIVVRW